MFVSLGTGSNQIPLLIALKNLDIPIIGIDQNPEAEGKYYCDYFFISSIQDIDTIYKLLKPFEKKLSGIYSRSFGKNIQIANELAKMFQLPHNPLESIKMYENKKNILSIAIQYPELKYQKHIIENIFKAKKWIIKHQSSYGKKNIFIENNKENIDKWINQKEYIIEPYYEGKEYIFFGFIIDKQLFPLIITQKNKNLNHKELLFCDKSHFYPNDLSYHIKYKIFQISNYIIKKTKLLIGPFLAEFIVNDNHIFFIEAAPEVGGEFICDFLVPEITGIPYFEYLIQIYTGKNYESLKQILFEKLQTPKNKAMLIEYILQKEGIFKNLYFPKDLFFSPYYYFHKILKKQNSITSYENKNLDRIGVFVLYGETDLENLIKESDKIQKNIQIQYESISKN